MRIQNFILILFLISQMATGQTNSGLKIDFSYGLSNPLGSYQKYIIPTDTVGFPGGAQYATYKFSQARKISPQFNMDLTYFFGKWGGGINIGTFSHKIDIAKYDITFPYQFVGGTVSGKYIGMGPDYLLNTSKVSLSLRMRVGLMMTDNESFEVDYTGSDATQPVNILKINAGKTKNLPYSSIGIKIAYPLLNKLDLFIKTDYLTVINKGILLTDTYSPVFDADQNNLIDIRDVSHFTIDEFEQKKTHYLKPQMLNFSIGFSYQIMTRKKPSGYRPITPPRKTLDKTDENMPSSSANQRGKRKAKKECLENGGTFMEKGDGSYFCMHTLSTARQNKPDKNKPELFRSKKRKCWRAGGTWVTNQNGSFCWIQSARQQAQLTPGDTEIPSGANQRGRRKAKKDCLENGGTFMEKGDGSYFCMRTLSTARQNKPDKNKPELFRSKKRKCWRAGGTWVTNQNGSFCWIQNASSQRNLPANHRDLFETGASIIVLQADDTPYRHTNIKIPAKKTAIFRDRKRTRNLRTRERQVRESRIKSRYDRKSLTKYKRTRTLNDRQRQKRQNYDARHELRYDDRQRARIENIKNRQIGSRNSQSGMINSKNQLKNALTKTAQEIKPESKVTNRFYKVKNFQKLTLISGTYQLKAPKVDKNYKNQSIRYQWEIKNMHNQMIKRYAGQTILFKVEKGETYKVSIIPVIEDLTGKAFILEIIGEK